MTDSKEREAFERWVTRNDTCDHTLPLALNKNGDYEDGELKPQWEAWQARAKAVIVPEGWRLVPVELAARVQDSLGRFTSDEGFGQEDVDTADDFAAVLAEGDGHGSEDIEAMRKDAERYRYLKTSHLQKWEDSTTGEAASCEFGFYGKGHDVDQAIDAAMAAGGE